MIPTKVVNLLIVFMCFVYNCFCLNNFTSPQLRSGGWTPIPTKISKLLSEKLSSQLESDSMQTIVSTKPQTNHQSQQQHHQQKAEMLPIPVIKPHAHGATLGFNLPEQGLTLYLDINELATKPLAQNIGLKVVSHDSHQAQPSSQPLNHVKPLAVSTPNNQRQTFPSNKLYNNNESPLSQFVNKMQIINNSQKPVPITIAKIQKRVKGFRNIGSYEGNTGSSSGTKSVPSVSKYHVGYMRPMDLQNALQKVGLTHSHNQRKNQIPNSQTVIINTHTISNTNNSNNQREVFGNNEKLIHRPKEPKSVNKVSIGENRSFKPDPNKYFSTPITFLPQISLNSDFVPETNTNQRLQTDHSNRPFISASPQPSSYSYSSIQIPSKPSIQFPNQEKEPQSPVQQTDDDFIDNEVAIITTTQPPALPPQEEDAQQKTLEEDDNREVTTKPTEQIDDSQFEEPQKQINKEVDYEENDEKQSILVPPPSMPTTNAHFVPTDDDTIIKPFPAPQLDSLNTCPSVQTCKQICDPNTDNLISESSNIREIIQQLNADSLINTFPALEDELQNLIDFSSTNGYTLFLPSNDAVSRLPLNLFEFWKNNVQTLTPLLDNHVLETAQSLEDIRVAEIIQPRSGGKLRVNRAHNDSYTINGERIVMANQVGPSGGMIHVIDGILYPNSDKDILETLKSCNRLDGFVTLAEGTGFSDTLKQSGPFTLFVPSNEALQKVPDKDLDIIRNNMTALREFLKYHVAQGSYYSNDLRDGQFIPSLADNQYIQVGVRVDGCKRRLVEANVSPLYRADIPASNGVIHVIDWILKPTDRDWCENVILPR